MKPKNTKFKKKTKRSKKKQNNIGKIYNIHPWHVVKKKDRKKYKKTKKNQGSNWWNTRPVAVTVQRGNRVQVSKLTSVRPKNKSQEQYKVKLKKTYPNRKKDSYISVQTMGKSRETGKNFMVGKPPLNKRYKRMHKDDLKDFNKARSKYLQKKKRKNKKSPKR